MRSFSSLNSKRSTRSSSRNFVSPASMISTFFIIWRTMVSICLSLIFTPCKRYTSWISFTTYSCTANGPLIVRISAGAICPSLKGIPALIKSPSWARIWRVRGTRYFLTTSSLLVTMISRLPRLMLPKVTTPSISETIAGLPGLRASNNSVTRGRPPVISRSLPSTRGIFTNTWPATTSSPSSSTMCEPTGKLYVLISLPSTSNAGIFVLSFVSITTFSRWPVCSSASSRNVIPSMIFSNLSVPAISATTTLLNGSHVQRISPFLICWPSFTASVAP